MRAQITHARSLLVRSPYLTPLPIWSNQPSKGTTCSAPAAAAAGAAAGAAAAAAGCEEEEEEEEDANDADAEDADGEEEEEEEGLRRLPGPCVLIKD